VFSRCIDCGAGKYLIGTGSVFESMCTACEAGTYSARTGATAASACVACQKKQKKNKKMGLRR
jgi:hypothetical protein